MWGTTPLQRFRLGPLYLAMRLTEAFAARRSVPRPPSAPWHAGISIVIPDRDAPEMLSEALASLPEALARIDEPSQIVVVANGAPPATYSPVRTEFPSASF